MMSEVNMLPRMLENKNDNTLDAVMIKTIREQAKQKNYKFE